MRPFPNIEILTPADAYSTKIIAQQCAKFPKFRFVRLDRDVLPNIYNKNNFNIKNGYTILQKGKTKCVISNGYLLHKAKKILNNKKNNYALIDLFKLNHSQKKL